jgi:hypothetical protein
MSSSVFVFQVLPSLNGKLHDSAIRRDESPISYWAFMVLFIGFAAAALAVSIWQFTCIWKKMRGKNHVA